ncbi:MAG TPA: hypothetical protein VFX73_00210 [Chitinophagaceae bacterium]|nr:hypothetical protein [Chitinophagaceae bacterium]
MKYTKIFLVHLCTLLIFAACSKDERSAFTIDAPGKANKYGGGFKAKDFRLKTIKNTITYSTSLSTIPIEESYELIYNNRGEVERINKTAIYDDLIRESYYLAYFKGARMDSITGNSISGSGPLFSGFKYKGNRIVEVLFHSGYGEPERKTFEYDRKGNLLNGLNGLHFIYDEKDLLAKIVYPIEHFSAFFSYEETPNPLYIENLHLFFVYGNLSELCYSKWNIAVKKQGLEVITHQNSYDELGRLKTKNYSEGIASFHIEFSYH